EARRIICPLLAHVPRTITCTIGHLLLNCNRLRYERSDLLSRIDEGLGKAPITLLLGPRQCGKTTLARYYEGRPDTHWFDLENYLHRSRLEDKPMGTLASLRGRVILDEVQLLPQL